MKINERTLVAHATCATPVDKEGWLWKRGEVNKSFQRRYFVLKGNLLFYFERKGDREPVGVVILEGCTIELAEDEQEKFAFKIVFHGEGKRTYVLGTETQVRIVKRLIIERERQITAYQHDFLPPCFRKQWRAG